ncbi:MAG TPA: hypothetical protein PLY88_00945 [Candidatus Omnitrophota bacterium]|nr:hypothetical protein [Candidatus Omnitrophota bacterium]
MNKYFKWEGALSYFLLGQVVFFAFILVFERLVGRISEEQALYYVIASIAFLGIVFYFVYPIANSGVVGGGSDNDDAYNLAARALLKGVYPYREHTYLGGGIAYFPGAIFLSLPAVILGNAALQTFVWLIPFCFFLKYFLESWKGVLFIISALIIFCPTFIQTVVVGSDLIASGCYIFLSLFMFIGAVRQNKPMAVRMGAIVFLGMALSSRTNYLFFLPLLGGLLLRERGFKVTCAYVAAIILVYCLVTLPFFFYSPKEFSPLIVQAGKLSEFDYLLPNASKIILTIIAFFTLIFTFHKKVNTKTGFLILGSILQAIPLVFIAVLASIKDGSLNLGMAWYFFHFLFFSMSAGWLLLCQDGSKLREK